MLIIYNLSYYFLLFFIYSMAGWIMEVIAVGIEKRKIVNRGFLIGPYCPIYGISSLIMILLFSRYSDDPFVIFILATVVCTFFEYISSYFMEKIFKARWWDYTNKPFNINGRVCLTNSVIFGVLGVLLIIVVNPVIDGFLKEMEKGLIIYISTILFVAFLVDNIISFNIISKFTSTASLVIKDNTEEITEKIREILEKKSLLSRRLIHAFPDVKALLPEIKAKYEEGKRKFKEKMKN